MKWRSIFGKKRSKEEEMEDYYSQITSPKPLSRSDSAPCFPASLAQLSLTTPLPNGYVPPSMAMTTSMNENMMWSASSQHPSSYVVPRPPTLLPTKTQLTTEDELFHSPGGSMTVAFCPKCHTIVQPITKRRSNIRTNPWLGSAGGPNKPSSVVATTPGTIADSGISDHPFMSDVSPATSEARSVPVVIQVPDDRSCHYAKVIRPHNSNRTPSVPSRPHVVESKADSQSEDLNKKRRKKKKHRRKKSTDSLESSEPSTPRNPNLTSSATYLKPSVVNALDKTSETSGSRHHLSSRPLPRVHEDEILMSSSVIHQPLPARSEANFQENKYSSLTDIRSSTISRQHLRQRIEALKADKRRLEQQFNQAQWHWQGDKYHKDSVRDERDKQTLLNTLASAHRRLDHQIASLMVTWRSLFDTADTNGNPYSYYDYANSQTSTLPRHW